MALHRCKRRLRERVINQAAGVKCPPLEFSLIVKVLYPGIPTIVCEARTEIH